MSSVTPHNSPRPCQSSCVAGWRLFSVNWRLGHASPTTHGQCVYLFPGPAEYTFYRSGSVDARLGLTSVTRSEKLTAYGVY